MLNSHALCDIRTSRPQKGFPSPHLTRMSKNAGCFMVGLKPGMLG